MSGSYSNRDNSQYQRAYIEADLKIDAESVKNRLEVRLTGREDAWVASCTEVWSGKYKLYNLELHLAELSDLNLFRHTGYSLCPVDF